MRHTIGILALLGSAIASVAGPNWWWIASGDYLNSESLQHLALGTTAVLTLLLWYSGTGLRAERPGGCTILMASGCWEMPI